MRLSPQVRTLVDASYAKGKESYNRTVDLAGYLDLSLKPIGRKALREADWARARYLWFRTGFVHIFESEEGFKSPSEERVVLALYGKARAPAEIWLEGRVRTDLRWILDEYSTRYRFRAEASREFTLLDRPVNPYANVEWYYDTRYAGRSRVLLQAGSEFTIDRRFRFELYYARERNIEPRDSYLNAVGVTGKVYF